MNTIETTMRDEGGGLRAPREAYAASDAPSRRTRASALALLVDSAGGPRAWASKLVRVGRTLRTVGSRREVARRIARLEAHGSIEAAPTRLQLVVLGIDMLRYFIEPGARDYYRSRGIGFGLHQVLRVLDDPCSMIDPVGILSERDVIIGHLLQVVHANPVYDLQLLQMFDDGLSELEAQTAAMLRGDHPRATSIGAIVEDPEYHARLFDYVRRWRVDPGTPELRRRALDARNDASFVLAEETFGAMPTAFRYARRLPTTLPEAVRHVVGKRVIDPALCEPGAVARVRAAFGESALSA